VEPSILSEALQVIRRQEANLVIVTDGSASDGNGGAAVVVTQGDHALPEAVCTDTHRGSAYTSSFEEREAMKMTLNWLIDHHRNSTVLICTDSQAAIPGGGSQLCWQRF